MIAKHLQQTLALRNWVNLFTSLGSFSKIFSHFSLSNKDLHSISNSFWAVILGLELTVNPWQSEQDRFDSNNSVHQKLAIEQ